MPRAQSARSRGKQQPLRRYLPRCLFHEEPSSGPGEAGKGVQGKCLTVVGEGRSVPEQGAS